MALLKCPECGAAVSSNATTCMKCGFPVSTIIENIEAEKKTQNKDKIKKIGKISAIVIGIVIVILVVLAILPKKNDFYYQISWNTNYDSTLSKLESKFGDKVMAPEDKESIYVNYDKYLGIEGLTSFVVYKFENNQLIEAEAFITLGDDCELLDYDLSKLLSEKLNKLYGEGKSESTGYSWETKDTEIEQIYLLKGAYIVEFKAK